MDAQTIQRSIATYGLNATAYDLAYRAANKLTELMVLKGIVITMDTLAPEYLDGDRGHRWGFLGRSELMRALSQGAEEDMDAHFIDEALARGDRCYGALDGDTLASYGWYSTRPTRVNHELELHFDPAYAYMYKGFTLPAYRGQRLHGVGMARALEAHTDQGLLGLVSYVKANNFPSLRSCYRMGYKDFGQIVILKVRGRYWIQATEGCKAYDFRIEPVKS